MNKDFDKRFKKSQDDFDRDFKRLRAFAFIAWIVGTLLTLGILGFVIWAIIMVMQHFSVI